MKRAPLPKLPTGLIWVGSYYFWLCVFWKWIRYCWQSMKWDSEMKQYCGPRVRTWVMDTGAFGWSTRSHPTWMRCKEIRNLGVSKTVHLLSSSSGRSKRTKYGNLLLLVSLLFSHGKKNIGSKTDFAYIEDKEESHVEKPTFAESFALNQEWDRCQPHWSNICCANKEYWLCSWYTTGLICNT